MAAIAINADGAFGGYASVFNVIDDGGDRVAPGAFAASLGRRGRADVRMLFQHDPKEPIGRWDRIAEDAHGLWVEGCLVPQVPRADALKALIARGAIDGLSIGFRTVRASRSGAGGVRTLHEIDLWEISIVTFPMMNGARIAARSDPTTTAALKAAIQALKH